MNSAVPLSGEQQGIQPCIHVSILPQPNRMWLSGSSIEGNELKGGLPR